MLSQSISVCTKPASSVKELKKQENHCTNARYVPGDAGLIGLKTN